MNETRITELRQNLGWTQERLAETSGVSLRTIQRIEAGNDASLETLSLIADALDVQVSELFTRLDDGDLGQRVESLEDRTAYEQGRRDTEIRAWRWLYVGLGIVVTLGAVLTPMKAVAVMLPAIIVVYWAGGYFALRTLMALVIEPRLDAKYPLSKSAAQLRARKRNRTRQGRRI